jgi:hypothetical protein
LWGFVFCNCAEEGCVGEVVEKCRGFFGDEQVMGRGKRMGFGGMRKEVVGMSREYFRMSRRCCEG